MTNFINNEIVEDSEIEHDGFLCPECGKNTLYQDGNSIKCSACGAEM